MYAQTTQQTEQQLFQLQGEVRLNTSRKQDLLKEIERLQVVKSKEIPELQARVKELKTEHQQLIDSIATHKKELQQAESDLFEAKKGVKFFTESEIARINRDISQKWAFLDKREGELTEKEEVLAEIIESLEISENQIIQERETLTLKLLDVQIMEKDLKELDATLDAKSRKATSDLLVAHVELKNVEGQLSTLKEEVKNELEVLKKFSTILEDKRKEYRDFIHETERLRKEATALMNYNNDRAKSLEEREKQIADREEAVTRNVEKLRLQGINL